MKFCISFSLCTRSARVGDWTRPMERKFFPRRWVVSDMNRVRTAPQTRSMICLACPASERL